MTNAYTESLNSLIRVMNRLRGYSFEALRAKILFTEGAHKHKLSRPKFERRHEPELAGSLKTQPNPDTHFFFGRSKTAQCGSCECHGMDSK